MGCCVDRGREEFCNRPPTLMSPSLFTNEESVRTLLRLFTALLWARSKSSLGNCSCWTNRSKRMVARQTSWASILGIRWGVSWLEGGDQRQMIATTRSSLIHDDNLWQNDKSGACWDIAVRVVNFLSNRTFSYVFSIVYHPYRKYIFIYYHFRTN